MKYLESRIYYNDLYDKFTVENCRLHERIFLESKLPKYQGKEIQGEAEKKLKKSIMELSLMFIKGERYSKKDETIRKWEDLDRKKDEDLENAIFPEKIKCLQCGIEMRCESKDFHSRGKDEKILFIFRCHKCGKGRAFYEDEEEFRVKPSLCPKCGGVLGSKNIGKNGNIKILENCVNCSYEKIENFDFSNKKKKIDKNFIKDRERFCMTEKEGSEYFSFISNLRRIKKLFKEEENKKTEIKVKSLKISEVKEMITEIIQKEKYSEINFRDPELGKEVIVEFTVYDEDSKRKDYNSRGLLKKLINGTLEGTNWKLMSEGINSKLGILNGRLRGKIESDF